MTRSNLPLIAALATLLLLPYHAAYADSDYLWNCQIDIENTSNTDTLYLGETMVTPNTTGAALLELEKHQDGEITFEGPNQLELKLDDGTLQTIANVNYISFDLCDCGFQAQLTKTAGFSGNPGELAKISVLMAHIENETCDGYD